METSGNTELVHKSMNLERLSFETICFHLLSLRFFINQDFYNDSLKFYSLAGRKPLINIIQ